MLDLIKACENETALEFLEESLVLTEEQKRAVLQQRIIFWTNAMADELQRETETPSDVISELMTNWTDVEMRQFNTDWANDEFLVPCEDVPPDQPDSLPSELIENQVSEGGKRKSANDIASPPKRMKPEEYFTIKSAKQVNVRKFKTTGTDYTVQFNALNIHGVLNIMPVLNRAFKHLFDRLTDGMAPHDQVRLNSHQLDRILINSTGPSPYLSFLETI